MNTKILSKQAAESQFNVQQYDPLGLINFETYVLLDGDVSIKEKIIDQGTLEDLFLKEVDQTLDSALFIINGNLEVKGDICIPESMPCILVLGDLYCQSLHSFDNIIHITGNAIIQHVFNGNYNHGSITIEGTTKVPFILNSDHDSRLTPSDSTISINYYSDQDDFLAYDYYSYDLERIIDNSEYSIYDSENETFDYNQFIQCFKSGSSPIKKGVKPERVLIEDKIRKIISDSTPTTALDLSDKKLKSLPKEVFEIEQLETLSLQKNNIKNVPKEIENLEVLNLSYCQNLQSLPESIGNLKKLKKLVLWCFQGKVPDTISELKEIEELDIYGIYQNNPAPVDFPHWVFSLKSLKVLKVNNNSFKNIPKEILKLENLEKLNLNSALCYVQELPDLSQLKKLVDLEADGRVGITTRPHVQQEILQNFYAIKSLERLRIDSYGEEEVYLNSTALNEMWDNVKDDPKKADAFKSKLRVEEGDSRLAKLMKRKAIKKYYYKSRRAMELSDFKGMENLTNLKYLNIAWNKLSEIPPEILNLKNLEHIVVNGNRFPETELEKLKVVNPKIVIEK